jgi:hypothetical protein
VEACRGCDEQEYELTRPMGFKRLKKTWGRFDAALRKRKHRHQDESWADVMKQVCDNIQL